MGEFKSDPNFGTFYPKFAWIFVLTASYTIEHKKIFDIIEVSSMRD